MSPYTEVEKNTQYLDGTHNVHHLLKMIKLIRKEAGSSTTLGIISVFLVIATSSRRGIQQGELAKRSGIEGAGLTRCLERLSKYGRVNNKGGMTLGLNWVYSEDDPVDRRFKIINLTADGLTMYEKLTEKTGGKK